jgi:YesN/AraC family two-component response regulator
VLSLEFSNKSINSLDDIRYICKNIFGILRIPIYFLSDAGELIFEFSYEYSQNPLHQNYDVLYSEFLITVSDTSSVVLHTTNFFETFAFLKIHDGNNLIGNIILGPCLTSEIDEKAIDDLIRNFNIQAKNRKKLVNYYQHMVVLNYDSLIQSCSLLYFSIYHEQLDRKVLIENNKTYFPSVDGKSNDFDCFMLENRKDSFFHHTQKYENELLSCIREGSKEKLLKFMERTSSDGDMGLHSKNPLSNQKNLFISFVPLVSHAAVEGGLGWELSLTLSDYYVQSVEEKNTINDILNLFTKMFFDYADRVRLAKAGHSLPVVKCKNYIFEHLFEKISLTKLAETTGMNASYVSQLFKKEVGLSISAYILKERIEEAKKIMLSSNKTLAEIYTPLGFIDQSHFTKVFKKFVGVTPKEYRLNNKYIK